MGMQIRKILLHMDILRHILPLIVLVLPLCSSLMPAPVYADDLGAWVNSQNVTRVTDKDGRELIRIIVPGRPPAIKAAAVSVPEVHKAGALNILSNVPAFDWAYGCSATSAAMMFGYYDRAGYSNFYTGPTNGGVCPLDNSIWGHTTYPGITCGECPINATHSGIDGRITRGHVDDYWIDYENASPDPYITNVWTEHTADSAGDFMGTSQSKYANLDGWTSFYAYTNGDPLYDYTDCEPGDRDGCHGMKLFVESRGYTVQTNFTQAIQGVGTDPAKGFTFASYCSEIDAGRPVLIQIDGHTMVGYGYDTSANKIYIHNTWDYSSHEMTWGGSYYGRQHLGVTVMRLNSTPPTVTNASGATSVTATTATLNGNLTSNGGADTTVYIHWGDNDGGTGTWDTNVNLGIRTAGAFSTPITSLSTGTTYYYRCSATNSAGTSWTSDTSSFVAGVPQKLMGTSSTASAGNHPTGYFVLSKFTAVGSGTLSQVRVYCGGAGNVKAALYADSSGSPGSLLTCNNNPTAVTGGQWSTVNVTPYAVHAGTVYWLAYISDGACVGYNSGAGGTRGYRASTYAGFNFPSSAGAVTKDAIDNLIAGWGTPPAPVAPTITNEGGASSVTRNAARLNGNLTSTGNATTDVTVYWGTADGGTTPGSWDNNVPLGAKPEGSLYTDISSLTASTLYYYRCFAQNTAGSAWASATDSFTTLPPPTAPAVINAGADNITDAAASLYGNLTSTGNDTTNITVYYGTSDGGTTSGSWGNNVALGARPAGTFNTGINGLAATTKYYYRCSAQNSHSTVWAPVTDNFNTAATPQRLMGATSTTSAGNHPTGYFVLSKFTAVGSGTLSQVRVYCGGAGNVKAALYADSSGSPGSLLTCNNNPTAVTGGQWSTVNVTPYAVHAGTVYWLAYISDGACVGYNSGAGGTRGYRASTYAGFNFPSSAGAVTKDAIDNLIAGWGPPPPAPGVAPDLLSPGTAITFKWGAVVSASKYHLQVNTTSGFSGTDIFNSEVGNVTLQEVTGLSLGTTYYWKVKAGNNAGWGPWSPTWSVLASQVP